MSQSLQTKQRSTVPNYLTTDKQVAECEQGEQMRPVLGQPPIAGLHMTELALDDAEGMLDAEISAKLVELMLGIGQEDLDATLAQAAEDIPAAVAGIYQFWRTT